MTAINKKGKITGSSVRVNQVFDFFSRIDEVEYFGPYTELDGIIEKIEGADVILVEHFAIIPKIWKFIAETKTPLVYEYHSFWRYEDRWSLRTPIHKQKHKQANPLEDKLCGKSKAIFAFSTRLGIPGCTTSLSITIPLISCVSKRLFPSFFTICMLSISATILSPLCSAICVTASKAISAK